MGRIELYRVIELTKGYVAIIDAADWRRVKRHKWRISFGGGKRPALHKPYAKTTIKGKGVYLHRFVVDASSGSHVDHLNHETLDCRKCNLEEITPAENNTRRRVRKISPHLKGCPKKNSKKGPCNCGYVGSDEEFYEGAQWTPEQIAMLKEKKHGRK